MEKANLFSTKVGM